MGDFQGPEDMGHVLMGVEGVRDPEKLEDPLVREASELVQGQGMGYNDLL